MKYALFAILILLFLVYPICMSIDVWGLLPKSQEDNTTIEDRVAEMIAEHNDPDAHVGTNESPAAHRENDIMDHPAGSVKGDKLVFARKVDLSLKVWTASLHPARFILVLLHYILGGNVINNNSYVYGYVDAWPPLSFDHSWMFETNCFLTPTSGAEAYIGIGSLNADTGGNTGIGFKIVGTTLYAYHIVDIDSSPDETAVSLGSFDPTVFHNYRVIYDHSASEIRFYLDGDLVHTFDSDLPTVDDYSLCTFYIKSTTTAYHNLKVADLHYNADPI